MPGTYFWRLEDADMIEEGRREPARRPEHLSRFFVERANAGDVGGLVALYEREAVLVIPAGQVAIGSEAIRAAYQRLLAGNPTFTAGEQAPAVVNGDLALTSTRIPGGATAEVARRQHDGTWLRMIDQPNVLA
jgi:ketosteroid isomerase-like protein